jgi:peptidoglycan hydrolase-like amidase
MQLQPLTALVRIAVFVLFHPAELQVQPVGGQALVLETGGGQTVLEWGWVAKLRGPARVTGRAGMDTDFILSVPGKIERRFHGRLEVQVGGSELQAIVVMDRETAVASAVAAESPPGAPLEEMKAQAVVSRSFYAAARGRHAGFDYCDTTHCQFLREPPGAGDPAFRAARETRNLVLTYNGAIVQALYSANCGGHTDSLAEGTGYPYFSVECPFGGPREGHGLGLCQRGAARMAAQGAGFRKILEHYYPNTAIAHLK